MEVINIGVIPDDQNADNLREGFDKINKNFKEVGLQKWTAKTYQSQIGVVHNKKIYILSDSATLPYNSTDFDIELVNGVWIDISSIGYINLKPELKTTKTLTTATYIDCSIAPSFILPTPTNNIIYDVINIQENKDIKLFVVGSAFTLGFTVNGYNVTNLLDIADGKKNMIQLTFLNNECLITNIELS